MHGSLKAVTDDGEIATSVLKHGRTMLPLVRLDGYNSMLKIGGEFVGDRANKGVFQDLVEKWRSIFADINDDPFPRLPKNTVVSKATLDELLLTGNITQKGVLISAIEDFATALAGVVTEYLKQKTWRQTDRIVVGGGFQDCAVGQLAVGRAQAILYGAGTAAHLAVIKNHPDEAGLIGAVYLMEPADLEGYEALLSVDIGGTNARCGIVTFNTGSDGQVCNAAVYKKEVWRHADEKISRNEMVAKIGELLNDLRKVSKKRSMKLAPLIGVGVPGLVSSDGRIEAGTQNLPGDWDADDFHLGQALADQIPKISGIDTRLSIHNDAVVQGLSEIPAMSDCERWGVLTIGTGLGNAHFTNRSAL